MSTSEQVNFVFRHQPKKSSKYGVLLTYINQDSADMTRCAAKRCCKQTACYILLLPSGCPLPTNTVPRLPGKK